MKTLKNVIESSVFDDDQEVYVYQPKDLGELRQILNDRIKEEGNDCDLNDIDVSHITDMSHLFYMHPSFVGDISQWDVSNVRNMRYMFCLSKFNGDISKWDTRNVINMSHMFQNSNFDSDISKWDVSKVVDMKDMFMGSDFNKDISSWKINKYCATSYMFFDCDIEDKYKPKGL